MSSFFLPKRRMSPSLFVSSNPSRQGGVMNRFILALILSLGLSQRGGSARAQERTLPTGDGYGVRAIAFSPDGKLLLTGHGADEPSLLARGHIKVWDVKSGTISRSIMRPTEQAPWGRVAGPPRQ